LLSAHAYNFCLAPIPGLVKIESGHLCRFMLCSDYLKKRARLNTVRKDQTLNPFDAIPTSALCNVASFGTTEFIFVSRAMSAYAISNYNSLPLAQQRRHYLMKLAVIDAHIQRGDRMQQQLFVKKNQLRLRLVRLQAICVHPRGRYWTHSSYGCISFFRSCEDCGIRSETICERRFAFWRG